MWLNDLKELEEFIIKTNEKESLLRAKKEAKLVKKLEKERKQNRNNQ